MSATALQMRKLRLREGGGRGLRSSRTGRWQSWDGSQVSRPTVRTVPEEASVGRDVSWLLKEGGI